MSDVRTGIGSPDTMPQIPGLPPIGAEFTPELTKDRTTRAAVIQAAEGQRVYRAKAKNYRYTFMAQAAGAVMTVKGEFVKIPEKNLTAVFENYTLMTPIGSELDNALQAKIAEAKALGHEGALGFMSQDDIVAQAKTARAEQLKSMIQNFPDLIETLKAEFTDEQRMVLALAAQEKNRHEAEKAAKVEEKKVTTQAPIVAPVKK